VPKKVEISGPTPFNGSSNGFACIKIIKSKRQKRFIGNFMYMSFRAYHEMVTNKVSAQIRAQTTLASRIGSLESIPGLLKCLQIRAQATLASGMCSL
jgi:hypothetical protein